MLIVYAAALLLGAALLFLVQPMVARLVLPSLGGSPAVWNTCMVFFQALLLAGYAYAHLLSTRLKPLTQVVVHGTVLLVPLVAVPIALPRGAEPPDSGMPVVWLLGVLALTAGLPFFAVSSAGPLLQRWFSRTDHPTAADPYFLYAASNVGSMAGLLAYPLWYERAFGLVDQGRVWSGAYLAFAVLVVACGVYMLRRMRIAPTTRAERRRAGVAAPLSDGAPVESPTWRRRALWVVLAAVPSSLMLGVTQHISTDLAAMPLLWVIPLALYLLTFILAFSTRLKPATALVSRWSPLVVLAVVALGLIGGHEHVAARVAVHLVALFVLSLMCHGRLADLRPDPRFLTGFYLMVAVGGVVGGVFNALVAPVAFDLVLEYPIALVVASLLRVPEGWVAKRAVRVRAAVAVAAPLVLALVVVLGGGLRLPGADAGAGRFLLAIGLPLAVAAVFGASPVGFALCVGVLLGVPLGRQMADARFIHVERTFFGVHRVTESRPNGDWHTLYHGSTLHGLELRAPGVERLPTSYYHPSGPIGQIMAALRDDPRLGRWAVTGLGVGALAGYAQAGQSLDVYEIDPAVVGIAEDPALFTYVSDARSRGVRITMNLGDARRKLTHAEDDAYGMIVLDAFSSDAVPVHLVTREAVELYLEKLSDGGLLVFNISNRNIDLAPVLSAIGKDLGLFMLGQADGDMGPDGAYRAQRKTRSSWIVMAHRREDAEPMAGDSRWIHLDAAPDAPRWTDDYSNILTVFRSW